MRLELRYRSDIDLSQPAMGRQALRWVISVREAPQERRRYGL
jgi:hypothetical protein